MPRKPLPEFVPPMMAPSVKEPFDSPDWIFEIKFDGYRAITVFDAAGKPRLWSRHGLPLEPKFPAIAKAVSRLKLRSTILDGEGKALFDLTKQKGMEEIIAKRKNSIYAPGKRTSDWLKIKARLQQEFVVGGFTEGKGSRRRLGALLLGAYRKGKLRYFGHSGSGFSQNVIDGCSPPDEAAFHRQIAVPQLPESLRKNSMAKGQAGLRSGLCRDDQRRTTSPDSFLRVAR